MTKLEIEVAETEMTALAQVCGVPSHLIGGLVRYIVQGILPGETLQAVLANDLMDAMGRADEQTAAGMKAVCLFLFNHAPNGCFGGRDFILEWNRRQQKRLSEAAR